MSYKITYKDGKTETIRGDEVEFGDTFVEFIDSESEEPNVFVNIDSILKIE